MSQELVSECLDAFMKGNEEDAVLLLPHIQQPAKVRSADFSKSSLLQYAAQHGWLDVVIELATKYKCDVNCKDRSGRTPLHDAARYDQLEVMKYLINEQHCDPMTIDNFNWTPRLSMLVIMVVSTSPTTLSVRHTVTHHVRISMV